MRSAATSNEPKPMNQQHLNPDYDAMAASSCGDSCMEQFGELSRDLDRDIREVAPQLPPSEALTRRNFLRASASGGLALAGLGWGETGHAADVAKAASLTLKTETATVAVMLSPQIKAKLDALQMRQAMTDAGAKTSEKDVLPRASFPHASVFRGSREHGNFQHHQQLTKFQGRYYLGWSNGLVGEEEPGQQILIASSADGLHWTDPQPAVARHQGGGALVHNCVGLLGTEKELFLYCWDEEVMSDAKSPGVRRIEEESKRVDLYASPDAANGPCAPLNCFTPDATTRRCLRGRAGRAKASSCVAASRAGRWCFGGKEATRRKCPR